jgi:hypothetical protein
MEEIVKAVTPAWQRVDYGSEVIPAGTFEEMLEGTRGAWRAVE